MKNVKMNFKVGISKKRKNARYYAVGLMKSTAGIILLLSLFLLPSCEKDDPTTFDDTESIIPERFKVDIPNSISSTNNLKSMQVDTLQGNHIYQHLSTFISVGDYGAELVQDVMLSIAVYNMNRPMSLTFISDEDNRPKQLTIIENANFEGTNWQYRLTMKDLKVANEGGLNDIGLQVFWSLHPLKGIAMLDPYNISRKTEKEFEDTRIRVDYSEAGELGYEAHMTVSITGFPLAEPLQDPYALSDLKMFVGLSGDLVTLYGNSRHPNARFFSSETGFNWAFVAAGSESQDIAVAEVGLPPMDINASDRETLLNRYSIKNVLQDQILSVWPNINQEIMNAYLFYTEAPGYFNQRGFVQAGTAPSQAFLPLREYIRTLAPYNPATISDLSIVFDEK